MYYDDVIRYDIMICYVDALCYDDVMYYDVMIRIRWYDICHALCYMRCTMIWHSMIIPYKTMICMLFSDT